MRYLNELGYSILIIGDRPLSNCPSEIRDFLWDAARLQIEPQLFSIFAATESKAYICDPGGGALLPSISDSPRLMINAFPFAQALPGYLILFKRLVNEKGLDVDLQYCLENSMYDLNFPPDCFIRNNTELEILAAVKELMAAPADEWAKYIADSANVDAGNSAIQSSGRLRFGPCKLADVQAAGPGKMHSCITMQQLKIVPSERQKRSFVRCGFGYAIVGFGLLEYFRNAIDSVIECDPSAELLVVCTGGVDAVQWRNFSTEYRHHSSVRFYSTPHLASGKCGALYDGYSLAIQEANKLGIKYLNVIQNDMQLLWWDGKLASLYVKLFDANSSACMVQTGFFRKGGHPDAHQSKHWVKRQLPGEGLAANYYYYESASAGMCDWGIICLERLSTFGVSFIGNEGDLGRDSYEKGLRLVSSPIPCVAPLPWPVVVRDGREKGVMPLRSSDFFLSPKNANSLQMLKNGGDRVLFQEDCVTQSYWALTPIWVTELDMEFFRIQGRYKAVKRRYVLRYEKSGCTAVIWPMFCLRARPNILNLANFFCAYWLRRVKNLIRQWLVKI